MPSAITNKAMIIKEVQMSRYIPFTEEELYQAHHKDIKQYLESIGEKVLHSGTEYMWAQHDSVKFRGHVWYQHSTGAKGTAVNFLMEFFDYSFQDAVITLLDGKYMATRNTRPEDMLGKQPDETYHKKHKVILPPKNPNNKRLYAYLCTARCINPDVVTYFIRKQLIYEDKDNHNIVFIGKDKKGIIRYAGLKGTLTDKPFRREITGSNKNYCFRHISTSDTLYVFEAFIDLFSYISLFHMNYDWHKFNYIALGGLYVDVLKKFLNSYPHIKNIVICTDNDFNSPDGKNHGQEFAVKVKKDLDQRHSVIIHTPKLKDWNEVLTERRKEEKT